jgi:hypothetical protein
VLEADVDAGTAGHVVVVLQQQRGSTTAEADSSSRQGRVNSQAGANSVCGRSEAPAPQKVQTNTPSPKHCHSHSTSASPCWQGRRLRCKSQSRAHQTLPAQHGCRGTAQHSTAQHSTAQHSMTRHDTAKATAASPHARTHCHTTLPRPAQHTFSQCQMLHSACACPCQTLAERCKALPKQGARGPAVPPLTFLLPPENRTKLLTLA